MKRLFALLMAALLAAGCALAEAEKLPAFDCGNGETIEEAACAWLLANEAELYAEGDVTIPCALILEADETDPADVLAWGMYSVDQYTLLNTTLFNVSAGRVPGLMHLKHEDGRYEVTSFESVGDGDDYAEDVARIFGMREGLAEKLDGCWDDHDAALLRAISDYVNRNGLPVTQMQDFGWAPVALINAPETAEEDQVVHHVSALGYSADYDLRQFSFLSLGDDSEGFAGVEALEGIGVDVARRPGEAAEDVIASLKEAVDDPAQEAATLGGAEATLVYDKARAEGVTNRTYVVPVEGGCLTVAVNNTYYTMDNAPVVEGADAALDALLGSFRVE